MCARALFPNILTQHITPTIDGKFWDFTSDLAKGDTAYTTIALGAHTDNTYFVRYLPASTLMPY